MTSREPITARDYYIALGLLLLSVAVRSFNWGRSGLWLDESLTAYRVEELARVFTLHDGSPWLFPLTVWFSTNLFGMTESALRLPSLIAGSLFASVIFLVLRQRFDQFTAVAPASIAALNAFSVYYAQEARTYALVATLGVAQFGVLWLILTRPRERPSLRLRILHATLALALALSHHYGLFVLAGGLLLAAVRAAEDEQSRGPLWSFTYPVFLALLLVWAPSSLYNFLDGANALVGFKAHNPFWPTYNADVTLKILVTSPLAGYYRLPWAQNFCSFLVVSSIFCLVLGRHRWHPAAIWAWQYLICLSITLSSNAVLPHLFASRYESAYLGIALVVVGLGVTRFPRYAWARKSLLAGVLVLQLAALNFMWIMPPKSVAREHFQFALKHQAEVIYLPLQRDFDPLFVGPSVHYAKRFGLPRENMVEMPRFTLPEEFVLPPLYYFYFRQNQAVTPEQREAKFAESLQNRQKVALIGQKDELEFYLAAAQKQGWTAEQQQFLLSAIENQSLCIILTKSGSSNEPETPAAN